MTSGVRGKSEEKGGEIVGGDEKEKVPLAVTAIDAGGADDKLPN